MKKYLTTILLFIANAASAQTYSVMQWGIDKSASPYKFGSNISGTWRDLGTLSSTGVWTLTPSASGNFANIAELTASYVGDAVQDIFVAGYQSAGDGGGGTYIKVSPSAPAKSWYQQSADGARWEISANPARPRQFGAKADNSTNDSTAFSNMISYCETKSVTCDIPNYGIGSTYALGSKITNTIPINITSDSSAIMRFTNSANAGFVIDYRSAGISGTGGLNTIRLPGLYSPATVYSSGNVIYPNYPSSWNPASRVGDGVTLLGGSRYNVNVNYLLGWNNAVLVKGTYDAGIGGRSPKNVNVSINTIDLSVAGVAIDSGPSSSEQVEGVSINANTIFAKYPVKFVTDGGSSLPILATVSAVEAFTNEANGACFYQTGTLSRSSDININGCYAGYSSYDSPPGTSTSLTLPYVAGNQSSNGLTTDGNATLGYYGGKYTNIQIGNFDPTSSTRGTALPAAGNVTRIRDVGERNNIQVKYLTNPPLVASTMSTTQGEANFAGGVGSAAYSKRVYLTATVSSLAAGASQNFYFYHTMFSASDVKPLTVMPMSQFGNPSFITNGLSVSATDNSVSVNRQGIVTFKNNTGSTIAGATYLFWVEVGN